MKKITYFLLLLSLSFFAQDAKAIDTGASCESLNNASGILPEGKPCYKRRPYCLIESILDSSGRQKGTKCVKNPYIDHNNPKLACGSYNTPGGFIENKQACVQNPLCVVLSAINLYSGGRGEVCAVMPPQGTIDPKWACENYTTLRDKDGCKKNKNCVVLSLINPPQGKNPFQCSLKEGEVPFGWYIGMYSRGGRSTQGSVGGRQVQTQTQTQTGGLRESVNNTEQRSNTLRSVP